MKIRETTAQRRGRLLAGRGHDLPKNVAESVGLLIRHFETDSRISAEILGAPRNPSHELRADGSFTSGFKKHVVATVLRALRFIEDERDRQRALRSNFCSSKSWRKLRYSVLKKRGAKCECCGATPQHGAKMRVDHIKPRSAYPELAFDEDNLQVLCEECNVGKSNIDETDWREGMIERAAVIRPSPPANSR